MKITEISDNLTINCPACIEKLWATMSTLEDDIYTICSECFTEIIVDVDLLHVKRDLVIQMA